MGKCSGRFYLGGRLVWHVGQAPAGSQKKKKRGKGGGKKGFPKVFQTSRYPGGIQKGPPEKLVNFTPGRLIQEKTAPIDCPADSVLETTTVKGCVSGPPPPVFKTFPSKQNWNSPRRPRKKKKKKSWNGKPEMSFLPLVLEKKLPPGEKGIEFWWVCYETAPPWVKGCYGRLLGPSRGKPAQPHFRNRSGFVDKVTPVSHLKTRREWVNGRGPQRIVHDQTRIEKTPWPMA